MVKEIIHDPIFLARSSSDATADDLAVAEDLADTLSHNSDRCVGMAANMIGVSKRIIVFDNNGAITTMFNPVIIKKEAPYKTEEGCLSLSGTRETTRYKKIKVEFQNAKFEKRLQTFEGFTAQIIQHEIDHTNGILI